MNKTYYAKIVNGNFIKNDLNIHCRRRKMEHERKKIGVIGAGVIGNGVAQKLAEYGYSVCLVDISQKNLELAIKRIDRNILFHNMMNEQKLDKDKVIGRIEMTVSYECLNDADVIIENIPEVISEKMTLYKKLNMITDDNCIFMVNTSCIPIKKIASVINKPEHVIGVHFMNPVPMQHFAEVIKTEETSKEVIAFVQEFLKSMEIDCTVINDSPGFVSNRISHLFMNEAANLVMEGVASPEQIDMIFQKGFHHQMGPLHTADLIGIDTVVNSIEVLYEFCKDTKFKCSPYLLKMVENGELGQKSGKGFFEY